MADVKHPDDVRKDATDPPCTVCGYPEERHPNVEGFHKYQRPTKGVDTSLMQDKPKGD